MRADLHLHSTASDGALAPEAVAALAVERRLRLWALTDHDSTAGWQGLGSRPGLVPGVEVTTWQADREVHIVLLGGDLSGAAVQELLARIRGLRKQRLEAVAEWVARVQGWPQVVRPDPWPSVCTRSHLADALVAAGRAAHRQQAFAELIGDAALASLAAPDYPGIEEVVSIAAAVGAVTILAHPGLYGEPALIEALMAGGLEGLEVAHRGCPPRLSQRLRECCQQRAWLASCGSDCHGQLPCRIGDWRLPRALLQPLIERLGVRLAEVQAEPGEAQGKKKR